MTGARRSGIGVDDIKTMGLYRNVERILADLEATGHGAGDTPLTVDDLTPFDQYHYEGTDSVDDAATCLGAGPDAHILDIGSGLGGPARYLADRSGARVTALELQDDLHHVARSLTDRCGLSGRVTHLCGDVLAGAAPDDTFTGLMSMLCFLHIPDRGPLFGACASSLRSGATMFIDDYYARAPLTADDRETLAREVSCPYLPDLDRYVADVEGAGFADIRVVDKTEDWTAFVVDRLDRFRDGRGQVVDRYGVTTADELDRFYAAVVDLFTSGRLGGLRLTAVLV